MSARTEEQKRRRYLLRLLEQRGPMSPAEVQTAVQRNNFATPRRLAALERWNCVAYDPTTDLYEITEHGMRRMGRKNKDSPGTVGPGLQNTAGASVGTSAPAVVIHIEQEVDRLILEMEGAAALALHVVRAEVDLWEHLSAALAAGMEPPALIDVPRRRRVQFVENHLLEWAKKIKGGPCQVCGIRTAQRGYDSVSFAHDAATEPTFHIRKDGPSPLCQWCAEFTSTHSLIELREAVGNAIAGTFGITAGGAGDLRYANPKLIPLASEVGVYSPRPWGHITQNPVLVRAIEMVAEQRVHPSRFVRTTGRRDQIAVPGIETPIHAGQPRSSRGGVTIIRSTEPTYRDELAAAERRHMDERTAFLAAHPRGIARAGDTVEWDHADKWTALLQKQQDELMAVDKRHPKTIDGRPRGGRSRLAGRPYRAV